MEDAGTKPRRKKDFYLKPLPKERIWTETTETLAGNEIQYILKLEIASLLDGNELVTHISTGHQSTYIWNM